MKTRSHETFTIPYENLDDIPLYEFEYWHRAYWNFIANNKFTNKPLVFSSSGKTFGPVCFACAFAREVVHEYPMLGGFCEVCPLRIKVRDNELKCLKYASPYYWFEMWAIPRIPIISKLICSYFARKVAKLEWKFFSLKDSQDAQSV